MSVTRRAFICTLACALGLRKTGLPAHGQFVHFGKGAHTLLHGSEMVVPKGITRIVFEVDGRAAARFIAPRLLGKVTRRHPQPQGVG